MPRGKKAEAKPDKILQPDKLLEQPVETDARLVAGREIDDETAQRAARESALLADKPVAEPDPAGNIDERMAALLADHIEMGVREG